MVNRCTAIQDVDEVKVTDIVVKYTDVVDVNIVEVEEVKTDRHGT